jgi:hypothetical protein
MLCLLLVERRMKRKEKKKKKRETASGFFPRAGAGHALLAVPGEIFIQKEFLKISYSKI